MLARRRRILAPGDLPRSAALHRSPLQDGRQPLRPGADRPVGGRLRRAFNIGLRHLDTFAAVESWSGYFEATDPSGTRVLDLGSNEANTAARVPHSDDLKTAVATWPSLIAFYVGNQDSRFLNMNKEFDTDLHQAGVAHMFEIYPGGHSRSLWQGQTPKWLSMALSYMAAEAKRRGL